MEAARKSKSPVIIQVSNGGGAFFAGKAVKAQSDVVGSVALAMHVRSVAKYYGIPVILHSDHCAKKVSNGK
jgi:fructose-bisphosphate aldolase class II